ncbi:MULTISPECIES: HU family DNA-binding protein [Acinetobacter]|uniref:HU family DNA-binding protein n=1 Tax=Acinetobacter TaxID=469 RepID=UPI0018C3263F|nr:MULTISPECIES: HU family DNA-binding protein [Acinetobacter]MBF7684014.1 HU family DNA-binding protein [Acinetobacter baretiae]MBF7684024.1 HU family DNA-binding protein [Acinetobacter baretiae]MBF7686473.1 HU family DNA-binding protein [Acinetobacter baretiae]MCF9047463.1 HU family DNA-binding protein [Acinetobacter nectaris]
MNKAELLAKLAPKLYVTQDEARVILNAVLETFEESLVETKDIRLVGFGAFTVKQRAERIGRNPKTGEIIKIEAKESIYFKAGKALDEKINVKPEPKPKKSKKKKKDKS